MKTLLTILCSALVAGNAAAQTLTQPDREALLDSLEKIHQQVDSQNDAHYRQAITAYRQAMNTDDTAVQFYINCVEKVEYTDMKRKPKDFRDWKKKEEGNLGRASFRRAIRHQLRWLCVTLEAASSNSDRATVVEHAKAIVHDVFTDLKLMGDQEQVLSQSPTATVFAKAYNIDGVKATDWPASPLDLENIYDKLVLPPLRTPSRLAELRAAWLQRIQYELDIRENMARYARKLLQDEQRKEDEYQTRNTPNEKNNTYNETKIGTVEAMRPPEYKQYLAEEVPELEWRMEVDLFKNGDQSGAAKRMLGHLQKFTTHKSAAKWDEEFVTLLKSAKPPAASSAQAAGPANEPPAQ